MQHYPLLDYTGAFFGFLSTVFYIKADKQAWPMGLIAISINIILYFLSGLYGDTSLEFIYFISTFYGWRQWTQGGTNKTELPITHLSFKLGVGLSAIALSSILITSQILIHFTHSQVPYWDASTTILSLIAQWLICRKIIQTWLVWFIVDAMYAGLYFYKGLPAHGLLLSIYVIMAIIGYLRWRQLIQTQPIPRMQKIAI